MSGGKKWKKEEEESFRFPNDECLGSAMTGGSSWGDGGGGVGGREGSSSAVQRLAFCIVGQLGIKVLCAAE